MNELMLCVRECESRRLEFLLALNELKGYCAPCSETVPRTDDATFWAHYIRSGYSLTS